MYIAKARGKNRCEVFHTDMHAPVLARLEIESELKGAMERGHLTLHHQPMVGLRSGRIDGLEALIRWIRPDRGMVPPGVHPVAEDSGLIHEIGAWWTAERASNPSGSTTGPTTDQRRRQTCRPGSSSRRIFPNGSPSSCRLESRPEGLVLEITETTVMTDTEPTVRRLKDLIEIVVRIAIDDFGTGTPRSVPSGGSRVDVLKIDRSFVANIDVSPADSANDPQARADLPPRNDRGGPRFDPSSSTFRCAWDAGSGRASLFARPQPIEDVGPLLARAPWEHAV